MPLKRHSPWRIRTIAHAARLATVLAILGCSAGEHSSPAAWRWTRLLGTDAGLERRDDLRTLATWVGEARLVGLGEGVHGTHELHTLAQRVFRYLAERQGFTVFALEVDQAHGAMLDDFVTGKRSDLDRILDQGWWGSQIFYDAALRDLLIWMRARNETAHQQVHVAGFDMKQPRLAKEFLIARLAELDPLAARKIQANFDRVWQLNGFGLFPNVHGYTTEIFLDLPTDRSPHATVRVALRVRSSGLTFGSAGISIRGDGPPGDTVLVDTTGAERSAEAAPPVGWYPLEAELDVSPETSRVVLSLFHRGNGTVWFAEPVVSLDGRPLSLEVDIADARVKLLIMPNLQVLDYRAALEAPADLEGRSALRVECDPRIDEAAAAAREIGTIVAEVARREADLKREETAWLLQMSRLIEEATEWRILAEPNRDSFLAENLAWLLRDAFPGSRVVALAHKSHTERRAGRMGAALAALQGRGYCSISMFPLAGEYRYFGSVAGIVPNAPLETIRIDDSDVGPLERELAKLSPSDLIVSLAELGTRFTAPADINHAAEADIAIVLKKVTKSHPLQAR